MDPEFRNTFILVLQGVIALLETGLLAWVIYLLNKHKMM